MSRSPRDIACQTKGCREQLDAEQALETLEHFGRALCAACAAEAESEAAADRATDEWLERRAGI